MIWHRASGIGCGQAPTGIITLGIDIVARAYVEQFRSPTGPSLSFFDANAILLKAGPAETRVFERYDPTRLMLAGEDNAAITDSSDNPFTITAP